MPMSGTDGTQGFIRKKRKSTTSLRISSRDNRRSWSMASPARLLSMLTFFGLRCWSTAINSLLALCHVTPLMFLLWTEHWFFILWFCQTVNEEGWISQCRHKRYTCQTIVRARHSGVPLQPGTEVASMIGKVSLAKILWGKASQAWRKWHLRRTTS